MDEIHALDDGHPNRRLNAASVSRLDVSRLDDRGEGTTTVSVTKQSDVEFIALARRTPITRIGIAELAKKLPPKVDDDALTKLIEKSDSTSIMPLAFALIAAERTLPRGIVVSLLAEVLSLDHVGPLVFATDAPALACLAFLEAKLGDLELECLVMLLAADTIASKGAEVPRSLLSRGRWLARHKLTGDAALYLGGAALRLKDADLTSLAQPHVNRAKRSKKTIDDAIATAKLPLLDVLDDVDGARVSSGFTVRHETPSVGRNDPCPCGSGKKYKKCHALTESGAASSDDGGPVPAAPKLDPTTLGADQAALLRPSELTTLETARLSPKAFVAAFGRAIDLGEWAIAIRMLDEAKRAPMVEAGIEHDAFALDALHAAYDAHSAEAAEKLFAILPAELAREEALAMDCVRRAPDLLGRIERAAEESFPHDADGERGMLLASVLLRWFPALGIYVARGAIHEGRRRASMAMLTSIEDARDRLLLSPFEPWWDVFDALFEDDEDRRDQQKENAAKEKMKADLRRARAASRKTAAEMEKLERRVAELDLVATVEAPGPRPKDDAKSSRAASDPELVEERRRLKTKIDELQRIIGEGQEERRELRRQIADHVDDDAPTSAKPARAAHADEPRSARDVDADQEGMHDAGSVELPRAILVPRFSDRAAKTVTDLAADAAEGVLSVIAFLAAGKPNAWSGVKQLTKVRGVLSARAGIHHRVLFSVASSERALDVLEVLHRRDLEQVVARLSRTS